MRVYVTEICQSRDILPSMNTLEREMCHSVVLFINIPGIYALERVNPL